jgi:hypothetical protein
MDVTCVCGLAVECISAWHSDVRFCQFAVLNIVRGTILATCAVPLTIVPVSVNYS